MRTKKTLDLKSLPIIIGIHNRMVSDLRKTDKNEPLPERQDKMKKDEFKENKQKSIIFTEIMN